MQWTCCKDQPSQKENIWTGTYVENVSLVPLKELTQLAWNMYLKICFRMKEVHDFNVSWRFYPTWTCFDNITRKTKNFRRFYSRTCFLLSFQNPKKFLPNLQSFLRRVREISLTWFLIAPAFKGRCQHNSS